MIKKVAKIIAVIFLILIVLLMRDTLKTEREDLGINESRTEEYNNSESILEKKSISLIFLDNLTGCELNGKIIVDEIEIGRTIGGVFLLEQETYDKFFRVNSTLKIIGKTDICFESDSGLPFSEGWYIYDLKENFDWRENITFNVDMDPRNPWTLESMQGFVRPYEVGYYLEQRINSRLVNNSLEDLDFIAGQIRFRYLDDWKMSNKTNYWQTPLETLSRGTGDCEDWAVTTLSLMRAYNDSLKCYNILWPSHLSVLCYFDSRVVIYDQRRTKFLTKLNRGDINDSETMRENKVAIREMRNKYFNHYGLGPEERATLAVFNDIEGRTFEKDEDFVDWIVNILE